MIYTSVKEIQKSGCFNVRKFITNAASLQEIVDSRQGTQGSLQDTESKACVREADETYIGTTSPPEQTSTLWCIRY